MAEASDKLSRRLTNIVEKLSSLFVGLLSVTSLGKVEMRVQRVQRLAKATAHKKTLPIFSGF
jgi:hypothetical protein